MGQNLAHGISQVEIFEPLCLTGQQQPQKNLFNNTETNISFCQKALKNLAEFLRSATKIFLMVQAGKAVDAVIENLLPYLETGDIIIDGNSHFQTPFAEKRIGRKRNSLRGLWSLWRRRRRTERTQSYAGWRRKSSGRTDTSFSKIAAKDFSGGACGQHGHKWSRSLRQNGTQWYWICRYAIFSRSIRSFEIIGKNIPKKPFPTGMKEKLASFWLNFLRWLPKTRWPRGDGFLLEKYSTAPAKKEPDDGQLSIPMKEESQFPAFPRLFRHEFFQKISHSEEH